MPAPDRASAGARVAASNDATTLNLLLHQNW
jgi:hypothetical protein